MTLKSQHVLPQLRNFNGFSLPLEQSPNFLLQSSGKFTIFKREYLSSNHTLLLPMLSKFQHRKPRRHLLLHLYSVNSCLGLSASKIILKSIYFSLLPPLRTLFLIPLPPMNCSYPNLFVEPQSLQESEKGATLVQTRALSEGLAILQPLEVAGHILLLCFVLSHCLPEEFKGSS